MFFLVVVAALFAGYGTAYLASDDVRYLTRAGMEETRILKARQPITDLAADPRSDAALTEISASCTASAASATSWETVPPSGTTTPVTVLGPNPIIRTRTEVGPAGTCSIVYRPSTAATA